MIAKEKIKEDLVEITQEEFEKQMDKIYNTLPLNKQEMLLIELEGLGNCELSPFINVKYYYDKKEKEYTYRVEPKIYKL